MATAAHQLVLASAPDSKDALASLVNEVVGRALQRLATHDAEALSAAALREEVAGLHEALQEDEEELRRVWGIVGERSAGPRRRRRGRR